MTEFTITDDVLPEKLTNRVARPNPFTGKFPTEHHHTDDKPDTCVPGKCKTLTVTLPSATDPEKKEVTAVRNLAQQAARDAGYTGRVKSEEVTIGTGKNQTQGTKLTIWSVKKIVHKPKTSETKPAETASN